MIEYFITLCLLGLLVTQGMLVRGCFKLPTELTHHSQDLRSNLGTDFDVLRQSVDSGVTLMDELTQIIADSLPQVTAPPTIDNPLISILGHFMGGTDMSRNHGTTQEQREIYEVHPDTTTNETENESN
jgi:hypothetical protein